jgi:tetratricopeptide (TPR) repeat protein
MNRVGGGWRLGWQNALFLAVVTGLVLSIYSASVPKTFLNWDDPKYILTNPLIQSLSLPSIKRMLIEPYFGNYAPVTMLSYALDLRLWGASALALHIHNVILHLACVFALYLLLGRLGLGRGARWLVVALFALHPTNVETVSWASERKNLLSSLFFLLGFWQYVVYTEERRRSPYLWSVGLVALSVLSKAGTVVAPLIFLAYDHFWKGERLRELRIKDKIPFLILAAIQIHVSIRAAASGGAFHSYHQGGALVSLLAAGRLLGSYLLLLVRPNELTPLITPRLTPSLTDWRLLVPFALTIVLLAAVWRRSRKAFFWVTFSALMLLPVMNIVPLPVVMANRYVYLPQIGVWALFGMLLAAWWPRLAEYPWRRSAVAALCVVWALSFAVEARVWARSWRNSVDLWSDALEKHPMNLVARVSLGHAFLEQGKGREAAVEFLTVLMLQPDNAPALVGMSTCEFDAGRPTSAATYAVRAIRSSPENALAYRALGRSLLVQRQFERARAALLKAHELSPGENVILEDLVRLQLASGSPEQGQVFADLMVRNSQSSYQGYWARARLLMAAGKASQARPQLETALALCPSNSPERSKIEAALNQAPRQGQ